MTLAGTVTADTELTDDIEQTQTYKVTDTAIQGMTDGIDALQQWIYHLLGTERYEYPIYSLDHGLQTDDLLGKDAAYVESELQRRVTDLLTADDRITSVDGFNFTVMGDEMTMLFNVHSIYGTIPQEVTINV